MIFLTVGTVKPFDRLVSAVDDLVANGQIKEDVFAQIGIGGHRPKNLEWAETLNKGLFDDLTNECSCIISHAGMGSILAGLNTNKPILVVPRLPKYGEIVNNHQVLTAEKLEQLGFVLAAYHPAQLSEKLCDLSNFAPVSRQPKVDAVIGRISNFIMACEKTKDE